MAALKSGTPIKETWQRWWFTQAVAKLSGRRRNTLARHIQIGTHICVGPEWQYYMDGKGGGCVATLTTLHNVPRIEVGEHSPPERCLDSCLGSKTADLIHACYMYYDRAMRYTFGDFCQTNTEEIVVNLIKIGMKYAMCQPRYAVGEELVCNTIG